MAINFRQLIIVLFFGLATLANTASANSLKSLEYSTIGDNFEISFKFSKTNIDPVISTTASPARVIMDFVGVKSKLSQKLYIVDIDNLKNIQVLDNDKKLRIIFNLQKLDYFQMAKNKRQLLFFSGPQAGADATAYRNKKGKTIRFNVSSNAINLLLIEKKLQHSSSNSQVKDDELEILWRKSDQNIVNKINDGLPKADPLNFKNFTVGKKEYPTLRRPAGTITEETEQWDLYFEGFQDSKKSAPNSKNVAADTATQHNNVSNRKSSLKTDKKVVVLQNNQPKPEPIVIRKSRILDFSFEKSVNNDAVLRLMFSNNNIDIDIQRHYRRLMLTFFNSQIVEEKIAIIDVKNFRTVIDTLDFSNIGNNATIEVNLNDSFEYLLYQAESKYSIIFSKQIDDNKLSGILTPSDKTKIDLNFDDIKVTDAIKVIADIAELDIILPQTLTGRISVNLTQVPWDRAIDLILSSAGYDSLTKDGVMIVKQQEAINKLNAIARQKMPVVTEIIEIQHSSAKEVAGFVNRANALTPRGKVTVDHRTNSLLLEEAASNLIAIRSLISQIDKPIQQISIEARIVVANTSFRNEIGVRWGLESSRNDIKVFANRANAAGSISDDLAVDLGAGNSTANINLGILDIGRVLDIELSAMESKGKGEVVSKPKIVTGNNQQAKISSGQEFAYYNRDRDGLVATTSFKQAVLSLLVTPQITRNDDIILDLDINQDTLTGFSDGIPIIDITKLQTKVKVKNGRTIILGGVFQNNESNSIDRVPLLGYIPLIGKLFQRKLKTKLKQEILIFITPNIII